ncbi:unnamed protein product [Linum tenue]|uniref:Aminotransferase-like plant mobile domain-containing protein n=1 Tax=Linum tenue TaxID=586396 RepID=A0AAV0HG59_9ROSI|nr:unnamed protein product [Linum tenue]
MVERWRKETQCFNFREGECTITLKDIAILTDLPIDGWQYEWLATFYMDGHRVVSARKGRS